MGKMCNERKTAKCWCLVQNIDSIYLLAIAMVMKPPQGKDFEKVK